MKLNCRPGDLARVVRDSEGLDSRYGVAGILHFGGCIVRVVECFFQVDGYVWVLEEPLECMVSTSAGDFDCTVKAIADWNLRPLPGLGELAGDDETLAWAGKPAVTNEPVTA